MDNLSNALQGRLSGVSVTQNAGTPGRESNIRVRAVGTFNNADPLYVIDGVVSDKFAFDGLNPEDVENLSVLKDGATAALYGSRAANGVILVTTRRGAVKPTEFAYNVTVGAQDAPRIPPTLDAYQHARTINDFLSYNRIPTSELDPNAQILINAYYPLPNRPGSPNYVYNTHSFTRYREELARLTKMRDANRQKK